MTEEQAKGAPKGPGSFCVPHAAIEALLDAKATAYEICAYLVLARFTDETGCCSSASMSAVNRYTGANKVKGGPVDRAIERLKQIRARTVQRVSNGRSGKAHQWIEQATDLGPILFDRATWLEKMPGTLIDGPHERAKVLFVLPDFGEARESRVWFGNNLVSGVGTFDQPLKVLKNAGDVAARLLLALYAANDMETWGGVRPCGPGGGRWVLYEPVAEDVFLHGGARLIRARRQDWVADVDVRISGGEKSAYSDALRALEAAGLMYEVVMVLNRRGETRRFSNGKEYSAIPHDAEPYYELDARSTHGYKPEGEEGIGGATANTASELGYPVTVQDGCFDNTYAAIVLTGFPAMIAGVYRLRFRVANPKNAGVKGSWAGIYTRNREAFELVQSIRAANKKLALVPPWEARKLQAAPTHKAPS